MGTYQNPVEECQLDTWALSASKKGGKIEKACLFEWAILAVIKIYNFKSYFDKIMGPYVGIAAISAASDFSGA